MERPRESLIRTAILAVLVAASAVPAAAQDKPNILVIWGDDIGQSNISAYTMGLMGYRTPKHRPGCRRGHDLH